VLGGGVMATFPARHGAVSQGMADGCDGDFFKKGVMPLFSRTPYI